jgi:hypothetical protein
MCGSAFISVQDFDYALSTERPKSLIQWARLQGRPEAISPERLLWLAIVYTYVEDSFTLARRGSGIGYDMSISKEERGISKTAFMARVSGEWAEHCCDMAGIDHDFLVDRCQKIVFADCKGENPWSSRKRKKRL